ncbi:hypothetical protein PENTCL1PPCAC_24982, partial [Pristionchus entomophagus]
MAEFVEQNLEELVPVFEQLGATQLLSEKEVNQLVKRCRRYDYRLQKSHKKPDDFINYGEYLSELLDLLFERRQAIGYAHKKEIIEHAIKRKAAGIYRRLCERFQGKLNYWLRYINFTSSRTMKAQTSKAFIQAMQMHPRSLELRIKAARWEWEENKSVDNARRGLQLALRLHPESVHLWTTLFEIELDYVNKIKQRRRILLEQKREGDEEEQSVIEPSTPAATDAVLQLRVAEIVMEQAMESLGALKAEEREAKMSELLVLLWRACLLLDATDADAARLRTTLEERMAAQPDATIKWRVDVEKRLAEGEDLMDALALKDWPSASAGEIRWAMQRLKEKAATNEDGVALTKARDLLFALVSRRKGVEEATEEECEEWARGVEEVEGEDGRRAVERAIERFPRRALFWRLALDAEGKDLEGAESVAKHADRINRAIEKAGDDEDAEEAVRLYQAAIDIAIQHAPETVEKVFQSSIDGSVGATHRALKQLRVDYLLSIVEEQEDEEKREKRWTGVEQQLRALVHRRPNSVEFYVHVAESLLSLTQSIKVIDGRLRYPDQGSKATTMAIDPLVDVALAAAVAEHPDSDDAWIARCELLMERAPLKVADVYRRAILSLKGEAAENFIARYTILQQAAAAK